MAQTDYLREWKKKNPEKVAVYARRDRQRHPKRFADTDKRWRDNHLEEARARDAASHRKQRANNPEANRDRLARYRAKQEILLTDLAGRPRPHECELCGAAGKIVFDHSHQTGNFRGWLCHRCNRTLGQVKDDVALLLAMADYVTKEGFGHGKTKLSRAQETSGEGLRVPERETVSLGR